MAKSIRRRKLRPAARSARKPRAKALKGGLTVSPKPATLAGRMREVTGPATFAEIARRTGTHPENARRFLRGGSVTLGFFRSFCRAYGVRADWLLEGMGTKERRGRL